jgi:AhpD family alkylhydroperoxidase
MEQRMKNPAAILPGAYQAIQGIQAAIETGGVDAKLLALVHLQASQINGCTACVEGGARYAREAGETSQRLDCVAVWRDAPYYTEPERAALSLAESMTRLSDRSDPVPDDVWNEAKRHFDERGLAALVLHVGLTNLYNRLNATTKQAPGQW